MDEHINKRHNVNLLMYHFVCGDGVEATIKNICKEIESRYEIFFIEVGADDNHVHFLVQSVPMLSPKQIVQAIKSISAREIFRLHPEIKLKLWGGQFWNDGYYVSTVGLHSNKKVISEYVKNQGEKNYKKIHSGQLRLF
jgi:REP element-mobilizing transposase RayT